MKALPKEMFQAIARVEHARKAPGGLVPMNPRALHNVQHMAAKVRALSYRIPMMVRIGDRGFTYSISGWARF